ncbi:MAG: Mov34/MPN/PAD-1 family protein [Burkholderiales bacterium]
MLTLVLPRDIHAELLAALRRAGKREVGGVLMAAHVGPDRFEVVDITVHKRGAIASFVRRIEDALGRLQAFFSRTGNQYTKFNYIGEWHSHPMFAPKPSRTDDMSMHQIADDPKVGANFVVLLIVKLDSSGAIVAGVHTYLPGGVKHRASVCFAT